MDDKTTALTNGDRWRDLVWYPGYEYQRRGGLFGRIIDSLVGRKLVATGPSGFVATSDDGKIITSPDGISWTMRPTPEGVGVSETADTNIENGCRHKDTKSIHRDQSGNLFQCNSCGMRTARPGELPWNSPGAAFWPDDPLNDDRPPSEAP